MSYSFTGTPAQTRPTSVSVWASQIVNAARVGRVRQDCGLRDHDTVMRLLVAFSGGLSQKKSATSAGISESGLRLWLDEGRKKPDSPYGPLARFFDAIMDARKPKPPPDVVVFSPPPPSVPTPPPPPSWQDVDPMVVHGWMAQLDYAARRERDDRTRLGAFEAGHVRLAVRNAMQAAGVTELPETPPPLHLEPCESWPTIVSTYTRWRRLTLQGGPTELDVELNASAWYRRHERRVEVPVLATA